MRTASNIAALEKQQSNYYMKKTFALLGAIALVASPAAFAEDVAVSSSTTTTSVGTTGSGTVTTFTPGTSLVVGTDASPVTYRLGSSVTYVDSTGAVIEPTMIKTGVPVTVHYVEEDGHMVADRVIVQKETTTTTTTTE